jgi:PAS domain S-box-containing protein
MSGHVNKTAQELRYRAEKWLTGKQKRTSFATSAELQKLVQELEVHQIELEMQNEELQQARTDLESYLLQYTDLYDFAPVGYMTLDRDGLILQVNMTGSRMLGMERARLVNQSFAWFVTMDFRDTFAACLAKVLTSQLQEPFELELNTVGSGKIYVHVDARISEDGLECRVALMDITEKKKVEKSLWESERKYRTLFETMSQGVVHQGSDGRIISANPAAERILGLSIEQLQSETSIDPKRQAVHEDRSAFPEETHPSMVALRTGKEVKNVIMGVYSPIGEGYVWLNINAMPQFLPGENNPFEVFVTFEDITDRKRLVEYNKLTRREKEVLRLYAKGRSRQIIATTLNISPKTVDKHKENLMDKLNFSKIEESIKFVKRIV